MIFIFIYFYMLGLVILEEKIKIKKKVRVFLSSFPLICLILFIKRIADYEMYERFYINPNLPNHFEVGYNYISNFFYKIGLSYHSYRVIILLIVLYCFSKRIFKIKEVCFSYFVLYIYTFIIVCLIQYRSGISLILLVFGVYFLQKKKYLMFLFMIYIAGKFHSSIIVFIPIIFLKNLKSRRWKLILGVGVFLLPFCIKYLYPFIEIAVLKGIKYFPQLWKLNYYIENFSFNFSYSVKDLLNILLFLILSFEGKYLTKEEKEDYDIYIWIFYLGIFYRSLFLGVTEIGFRLMILGQSTLFLVVLPLMRKYKNIKFLFCILSFFILISWLTAYTGIL